MDGGAWWAAVPGVAASQTRLSGFAFTFHFHALEKEWQPTPVFLPGESQGRQSLEGCRLWGRTELDTTEQLSSRGIREGPYSRSRPGTPSWLGEQASREGGLCSARLNS